MSSSLANMLYDREGLKVLDKTASEQFSIAEYELMSRAGANSLVAIEKYWPQARSLLIFCGPGNNGGDGYVLARLAAVKGYKVFVIEINSKAKDKDKEAKDSTSQVKPAAVQAREELIKAKVIPKAWMGKIPRVDLIIDALLGTGLKSELKDEYLAIVQTINAAKLPVLALDIPSGLDANTGCALGAAVKSSLTITFIGRKQGMYTGAARDYCHKVIFTDLAVSKEVYAKVAATAQRLPENKIEFKLSARPLTAHKGNFGHVVVIGGGVGMPGAVCLAGESALRVGAGAVTLASHPEHANYLPLKVPECMSFAITKKSEVVAIAAKANVILVGPGLGKSKWAQKIFKAALKLKLPMVVDADGLNLLAVKPCRRDNWILTPHPGEAARLLKTTVEAIEADRFAAIKALQERYGGVIILKGAGTLVKGKNVPYVCCLGNPGMATAGMGDVLAGIVAGLLAQGLGLEDSACLASWVHAAAGDMAAATGERGLIARDVILALKKVLNN